MPNNTKHKPEKAKAVLKINKLMHIIKAIRMYAAGNIG